MKICFFTENYIHAGIDGNKIYVSGHPYYKELKWTDLKFDAFAKTHAAHLRDG